MLPYLKAVRSTECSQGLKILWWGISEKKIVIPTLVSVRLQFSAKSKMASILTCFDLTTFALFTRITTQTSTRSYEIACNECRFSLLASTEQTEYLGETLYWHRSTCTLTREVIWQKIQTRAQLYKGRCANPGLNFNPGFYISFFQSLLEKIFPILIRTSNDQIASKKI